MPASIQVKYDTGYRSERKPNDAFGVSAGRERKQNTDTLNLRERRGRAEMPVRSSARSILQYEYPIRSSGPEISPAQPVQPAQPLRPEKAKAKQPAKQPVNKQSASFVQSFFRHREAAPKQETAVKKERYYDLSLLFSMILITGVGLLILYSSTQYSSMIKSGDPAKFMMEQAEKAGVGLFIAIVASKFKYSWIKALSPWCLALATVLLIVTIFKGDDINGGQRWLAIGRFSFQPSELAKTGVILFTAYMISRFGREINRPRYLLITIAGNLPAIVLILKENLSTAVIAAGILAFMLFVALKNGKWIGIAGAAGVSAMLASKSLIRNYILNNGMTNLTVLPDYKLGRVYAWAAPDVFTNLAEQTTQGIYAIGSGGVLGRGLGESIQKFSKLYEAGNDLIFTIICEELGFVGALAVMFLYAFMIYRILMVADNASDLFGSMVCTGVAAHLSIQVILNVAVVTGILPNTGITLPFISHGGTALICTMGEIGLVLRVSGRIRQSR